MFTGRFEPIPASGELSQPSTSESMAATFKADYMAPFLLIPGMDKQKRQEMYDRVQSLQMVASGRGQEIGTGQKVSNWFAGMAGSILNPLSLATGEAAGAAMKVGLPRVAAFTGRYLPSQGTALLSRSVGDIVGTRAPGFIANETLGSLSGKAVSGFAQGTGFSLPGEVAATYDPKTESFNWGHGIKSSFVDGGVGLLLMSTPYLAGTLWGKVFRGGADHAKMPLPGVASKEFNETHIDNAVQNRSLSPQEGQWFKDYLTKNDTNENLSQRATEMLIKDGHPVDSSTNQLLFRILHPDDVNNLQSGVADQLAASHIPQDMKSLVTNYITRNRMDGLRENPTSVTDGLKGVVSSVRQRLAKTPEEMVNFHKIMRRLLPESLKEENPFSQAKLYRAMKKGGSTGITVPSQLERRLAQEERINRLNQKVRDHRSNFAKTGKPKYEKAIARNEEKVRGLTEKLEPILSHSDEMKHLRSKLLPEGNVAENFKSMREYQRLLDLTRVRNDARRLMHEVHLKHEYEMHGAYADVLDAITKVMRSEFGKLASTDDVNSYMRERIQGRVPEFKNLEVDDVKADVKIEKEKITKAFEDTKSSEGREQTVKMFDEEMKETKASEIKDEYKEVKAQYDEFKDNETVFSNLVKCVLGGVNV